MAYIAERERSDGRTTYQVRWRENGERRSAAVLKKTDAERIKRIVDATGTWRDDMAPADVPTLEEWIGHHLAHSTRANPDTIDGYRRTADRHIVPILGDLALPAVTPDVVRTWVKGLTMADKTRKGVVSLLSGIMQTAVEAGHIPYNPVKSVRLPRTDPPADRHLITYDDLRLIVTEIPDHYKPLVTTLAGTGMRWGEAAALNVGDAELRTDPPTLRVTKAINHRSRAEDEAGQPKTRRAVRKVALAPHVVAVLEPLLDRPTTDPLFVNMEGRRVRRSTFYDSVWTPALKRAQKHGLAHRPRIHDLRAFATTWLIEAGVPIHVVADQLGHESTSTTDAIYRRNNPESGRLVAAAMGGVFDRVTRPALDG